MEDESELQARIARLAARINRHKSADHTQSQTHSPYGGRSWVPQRGTPYGVPRGRGWTSKSTSHRNRTLVLNPSSNSPEAQRELGPSHSQHDSQHGSRWVTKHDRHMQLINNNVYEQKARERSQAMEETRRQKQAEQEEREKTKLANHLRSVATGYGSSVPSSCELPAVRQIVVANIRFVVADGGSKLIKAKDEANQAIPTPKRATVGGVSFFRSRHGNLYRAGLVKMTRSGCQCKTEPCEDGFANPGMCSRSGVRKIQQLCPQFNSTGSCAKGPQCRYVHDPEKVAICREFLQSGKCSSGDACDLSHDPIPERVPACVHFARGKCTNPDCRYAHVKTNAAAPVCRSFAVLGYCSQGLSCTEKHVHECPDYANKGVCRKSKCQLPHVDRAGQLRKKATNESNDAAAEGGVSSDISSDAELDSDDFDSDQFEEDIVMLSNADPDGQDKFEQQDFVQL